MSGRIASYRDLVVWQRAMELVEQVYRVTSQLPRSERFGLLEQLRRAAVSIPANIAEGHGRFSRGDYVRHLHIANGSLMELETELAIAARLGFLADSLKEPVTALAAEVGRMLAGLLRRLKIPQVP